MEPAAVVPGFDPVADGEAGLSSGCEYSPVNEFFLQRGQDRVGGGVVPAHSGAAHRLGYSVTVAQVGELVRGVLGAPIGVEHDPDDVTAAGPDRFAEGVTDQGGTHMGRHRHPQDAPRREVFDEGEIEEPFPRVDVGDVATPGHIELFGRSPTGLGPGYDAHRWGSS